MKVSTKLAAGYGGLLVLLGGLIAYHVVALNDTAATTRQLTGISARLAISTTDQQYWLDQLQEYASGYHVLPADSAYLEAFRDVRSRFDSSLTRIRELGLTDRERAQMDELERTWERFREATSDLDAALAAEPPDGDLRVLEGRFQLLREQREALSEATRRAMRDHVDEATSEAARAESVSWAGLGAAALLAVGVWVFIVGSITRSLKRLTAGTRRVAKGDFAYRLEPEGEDEFAELSRDFNEMNERLGELDQLKRDFLSKVSHDLKSPLASIQEVHNLLLEEVPGELNPDQRRLLELNRQSGERLSEMIRNLLEVSRFEAGAPRLEMEEVDLRELAARAADRFEPTCRKQGVRLRRSLPSGPVTVAADPERAREVLENLLENALSFSPEGESVDIEVTRADGGAEIRVADRGPGVPDEEKEEIFDRFFQGDNGSERSSGGSGVGLGLTLCRQIVEAHDGEIGVVDREGGGSLFRVLLPAPSDASGTGDEGSEEGTGGRGEQVGQSESDPGPSTGEARVG